MCARRPSGIDQRRSNRFDVLAVVRRSSGGGGADGCLLGRSAGDDHDRRLRRRRRPPLRGQLAAGTAGVQDDDVQPDQLVFHAVAARRPTSARRALAPRPVHHVAPLLVVRIRHLQQRVSAAVVRTGRQRPPPTSPTAVDAAAAATSRAMV